MKDEEIINLYWNRQEKAIYETNKKYGRYCNTGVRIDIWTHLMRECIMKLCTPI